MGCGSGRWASVITEAQCGGGAVFVELEPEAIMGGGGTMLHGELEAIGTAVEIEIGITPAV